MRQRTTTLAACSMLLFLFSCGGQSSQKQASLPEGPSDYILPITGLPEYENDIDHAAYIKQEANWGKDWGRRNEATTIYRSTCYGCHGNNEQPGSLPNSNKFWQDQLKNGSDPYAMYQTLTRGYGQMPPHPQLVPSQKYAVISFIREEFIKKHNPDNYFEVTDAYLEDLPKGKEEGPEPQAYHPWADMDYGNWLMKCIEMSDDNDPPKPISGGRAPLPDEDHSKTNFAYKGIAVRLDPGEGGVAAGKAFAMFDHDLLRFVGFWTGEGFIDWEGILLDDQHNVYPRTVGERQFANPITPGWAHPFTNTFEDNRFVGVDGRKFGPIDRDWAHYKGLYRYDDRVIIKYTVGSASILETYDLEEVGETPIMSRTIRVGPNKRNLTLRVAPVGTSVSVKGDNVSQKEENGFIVIKVKPGVENTFKVFLAAKGTQQKVETLAQASKDPEDLTKFTKGSKKKEHAVLKTPIIPGNENDPYAVDVFVLPQENPWKSRVRLTGIDFIKDGKEAIICTIDGEVWRVEGINQKEGEVTWHRIATGLFQPLGIKYQKGAIYVTCRDQIAILRDLNGDGETDFYESFNSDHQVSEHYHEFAMGLQTDKEGNFYYAKSGRHARKSLIEQHGTLIKVSPDGKTSEILANGFRAANGVCLNPDGSFYVTDQQGFWNPMNRINRVTKGGFYGNMWGYGAPEDSSDEAMIQPMAWIDMEYDRSPSELVWADSKKFGPLNGSLLNLSYGYGKIFVVMTQMLGNKEQGGMIELPVPQFPTGIMRARFNPKDGQMYVCGMSAWATSRMIQVGGLYRVRYTGKSLELPIKMEALDSGMKLTFATSLEKARAENPGSYLVNTWDIKRTARYGSPRYNEKSLEISKVTLGKDGKTVMIHLPKIEPTWCMEIVYSLKSKAGNDFEGAIQNTIYKLGTSTGSMAMNNR